MATRIMVYDGRSWPDPDPSLTIEEVKQSFATFFPELSTADVKEHKDEKDPDTVIYEFARRTGTKG
jgi:PRTRC genetic system protein C